MRVLTSLRELEAIYGFPAEPSIVEEAKVITAPQRLGDEEYGKKWSGASA